VAQLDEGADANAEARRLRCSHFTREGALVAVS